MLINWIKKLFPPAMAVYIFIKYHYHINQFITIKQSNQVISLQNQTTKADILHTKETHKARNSCCILPPLWYDCQKDHLNFFIFLSTCRKFANSFMLFIDESDTGSCVGTSNDFRFILISASITAPFSCWKDSNWSSSFHTLWVSQRVYTSYPLFLTEWNWNYSPF